MSMKYSFFKHRVHIKLNFPDGSIIRRPMFSSINKFQFSSFEFVNAEHYKPSEKFMNWFMKEVYPQASKDPFLFEISMCTTSIELQNHVKQFQGTN